jgi:hypothetical protein
VIFDFYNCPDLDLSQNFKDKENFNKFLKDRIYVPKVVSNHICDAAYFNQKWAIDVLDDEFIASVTFARLKKKDCGIIGHNVKRGVAALWAICLIYNIPFYQMLEHIGIYDEK